MKHLLSLLLLLALSLPAEAGRRRGCCQPCQGSNYTPARANYTPSCPCGPTCNCVGCVCAPQANSQCPNGVCAVVVATVQPRRGIIGNAIDRVNALRAGRGLRAYQEDAALTAAALAAATYRAERRMAGHVMGGMGDFQFLPAGVTASAAGCAAWPQHLGFGACAVYDSYTFAGAATVIGADGLAYHHAFYR